MRGPSSGGQKEEATETALDRLLTPLGFDVAGNGFENVDPSSLPRDFARLLDHTNHMTTTLAGYHGKPVRLEVLQQLQENDCYSRLIRLLVADSDHVAEVGVMRFDLKLADTAVRRAVEVAAIPLGDILIEHDVMRRIEPVWFVSIARDAPLASHFAGNPGASRPMFGRIGRIHCHGQPAIELLEIVTDRKAPSIGGIA